MTRTIEGSVVRIFKGKTAVGAGTLVSGAEVITCLHVAETVVGRINPSNQFPGNATIKLDFPLVDGVDGSEQLEAIPSNWDASEEICVLRLTTDAPKTASAAIFADHSDLWKHHFRAYGFPKKHGFGVWASGRIRAANSKGWVQIVAEKEPGFAVLQGFSGGPVWDEELMAVVGVVVATDIDTDSKVAYIVPTRIILSLVPRLNLKGLRSSASITAEKQRKTTDTTSASALDRTLGQNSSHWKQANIKPPENRRDYAATYFCHQADRLAQHQRATVELKSGLDDRGKPIRQSADNVKVLLSEVTVTLTQIDDVLKLVPQHKYSGILLAQISECLRDVKEVRQSSMGYLHAQPKQRTEMRRRLSERLYNLTLNLLQVENHCRSVAAFD